MAFESNNPQREFKRLVVGSNIITPNVIRYGFTKDGSGVYEIAQGTGMKNEPLYGVSIRDDQGESIGGDLFDTKAQAFRYIDTWTAERSAS